MSSGISFLVMDFYRQVSLSIVPVEHQRILRFLFFRENVKNNCAGRPFQRFFGTSSPGLIQMTKGHTFRNDVLQISKTACYGIHDAFIEEMISLEV
jgi:hypothetical protein